MNNQQPIDQQYDGILTTVLTARLKRTPHPNEIINGDNDSDLVNETLWQLIVSLDARIKKLESQGVTIELSPLPLQTN